MEICTGYRKHDHDQIVHADGDCPLCEIMDKLAEANKQIEELENKLGEVEE